MLTAPPFLPPALERTFLAYHRTSLVFALTATVVGQLFLLNHKPNPNPAFGFHVIGKPLVSTLVGFALLFSILGWVRWFRWQRALLGGSCIVGGWDVEGLAGGMGLVSLLLFQKKTKKTVSNRRWNDFCNMHIYADFGGIGAVVVLGCGIWTCSGGEYW